MSTFKEYFIDNQKHILIPALQRDYVQGERPDIIKPFIDELLFALKETTKKIDLNYIYGSEENTINFVPIDGQQRLITLWLLHLYLFTKQGKKFNVKLCFYSREFANDFSMKLLDNLGSIPNKKGISEEIIDSSWFVNGWKYDKTVNNMLNTLEFISEACVNPNDFKYYENITFSFLNMHSKGLTDDIYVKMNGRGRPLSYYENLKSWMDEKVTKLFVNEPKFYEDWEKKMDNEWTDFFWLNRNKEQEHPEEIYDEQERFLYNLLRIFWIKKGKKGFVTDKSNKESLCKLLNIKSPSKLEENIISHISNSTNFTLPLYVLDNLDLFSKEFFEWAMKAFDGLCEITQDINNERLEFDFDNSKTTKTYKIFFTNENRQLLISSSIIDYIVYCKEANLHDWLRFTRNIICNIDDVSDTDNRLKNILLSFKSLANNCSTNPSCLTFISNLQQDQFTGISPKALNGEKKKAALLLNNEKHWRKRIEALENNKYFTGQIKFIFDFLGNTPKEKDYDNFSKVMNQLFSGNGKNGHFFSSSIDENVFSRALLCFTTDYSYGYQIYSNWSFLKSSKTDKNIWKRYINDNNIVGSEELPHNNALKILIDEVIIHYASTATTENFNAIIKNNKKNIKDWRRFFIDYPEIWSYFNNTEKFIRWNGEYNIGLVKSIQYGGSVYHAELRSYCLYLDYKHSSVQKGWSYDFYEKEHTCLFFEKEVSGQTIAIDAYFKTNGKSEDNYTLEIFLRPYDKESDTQWKSRSKNYLKDYADSELIPSNRGYKLKTNCSKEKIKEKINDLLKLNFK